MFDADSLIMFYNDFASKETYKNVGPEMFWLGNAMLEVLGDLKEREEKVVRIGVIDDHPVIITEKDVVWFVYYVQTAVNGTYINKGFSKETDNDYIVNATVKLNTIADAVDGIAFIAEVDYDSKYNKNSNRIIKCSDGTYYASNVVLKSLFVPSNVNK